MKNPAIKLYVIYFTLMMGALIILNISTIPQDSEYHISMHLAYNIMR